MLSRIVPAAPTPAFAKVFCFFSSEKKTFLFPSSDRGVFAMPPLGFYDQLGFVSRIWIYLVLLDNDHFSGTGKVRCSFLKKRTKILFSVLSRPSPAAPTPEFAKVSCCFPSEKKALPTPFPCPGNHFISAPRAAGANAFLILGCQFPAAAIRVARPQ